MISQNILIQSIPHPWKRQIVYYVNSYEKSRQPKNFDYTPFRGLTIKNLLKWPFDQTPIRAPYGHKVLWDILPLNQKLGSIAW